jgi:hypothetical protein
LLYYSLILFFSKWENCSSSYYMKLTTNNYRLILFKREFIK